MRVSPYFKNGIDALYNVVPTKLILWLVAIFVVGSVLLCCIFGMKKAVRLSACLLFLEYCVYLIFATVLCRNVVASDYNLTPFWSYRAFGAERKVLLVEKFLNVVAFMPIGVLLGCLARRIRWWEVALIAWGISITIEVLQFLLSRGFSEFDDVFHNTLGAVIGFGLYAALEAFGRVLLNRKKCGKLKRKQPVVGLKRKTD